MTFPSTTIASPSLIRRGWEKQQGRWVWRAERGASIGVAVAEHRG